MKTQRQAIRMKMVDLLYSVATGPERRRRLLTPFGIVIFIGLLILVVFGSLFADRALSLQGLFPEALGTWIGFPLLAAGLALWGWSLVLFKGKGVPFNPPRELVVTGPYAWMRNPMLTGVFIALLGLGFILNSVSLVFVGTPAFVVFNVIVLKILEEPELDRRFGASYNEYRQRVPMFVPRRPRKRGGGAPPNWMLK
jgi:protein-S-isoprenylcysteine O-methyltransferase Ste14